MKKNLHYTPNVYFLFSVYGFAESFRFNDSN